MVELLDLFNAYRVSALHLTSLLLAVAIWRWGGAPERWLMGIFLATMVVPVYVLRWLGVTGALEGSDWAAVVLLFDLVATVLFRLVALNANRNYPLWIAGFQLVAVGGHLVRIIIEGISPLAIAILVIGPSYLQLIALLGGFIAHFRRERRFGPYRSWRVSRMPMHALHP
jgi:hypothetical protein